MFKLFDPVSKKIIIFLFSADEVKAVPLTRTMVQKDYDFLITGHIGFGSRVPICGAVICGGCFVKKGAQLAAAQSVMPQILSAVGLFF